MKSILLLFACFAVAALATPRPAAAQCRNGACDPPSIQYQMPDQASVLSGPIVIRPFMDRGPVRRMIFSTWQGGPLFDRSQPFMDRGPIRRLISAPWRGRPAARR